FFFLCLDSLRVHRSFPARRSSDLGGEAIPSLQGEEQSRLNVWLSSPPTASPPSASDSRNSKNTGTCAVTAFATKPENFAVPAGSSPTTPTASEPGSLNWPSRSVKRVLTCSSGKTPAQNLSAISLRWKIHRWKIA